jgi:polyhydroxybutyrate depolymerase
MRQSRSVWVGVLVGVSLFSLAMPARGSVVGADQRAAAYGSAGCGSPAVAGASTQTIDVQGVSRQYRLAVPDDPTGKKPLALILNFHGASATDQFQAVYSQLEEKGPPRGFVVMTPLAANPPIWDNRETRPEGTLEEASAANLAFTSALIDAAETGYCIDTRRIYATGHSNGAGMATYLGCALSKQIAAIAPVAGVNLAAPCPHGKPVSVIAFHGTADPSVAYEGGPGAIEGRPNVVLPSVEAAMQAWAKRAGCRSKASRQSISSEVQRIAYRGCAHATGVELYSVTGGGHTWPGSLDIPSFGHVTQDINAADLILDFFAHHPPATKGGKSS